MESYPSYKDSGVKWIGEIPSDWDSIKLKYIGFLYGGLSGKSGKDFNDDGNPNNKPFIPFTNICENTYISKNDLGKVNITEEDTQNRVEKNDLFFLMSSEDQEGIGKPSVLKEDIGEVYLNTFCRGFRITKENYDSLFVNYLLSGHSYRELLSVEGRGFTRINLRSHKVSDFQIHYPPKETQTQIVSFLDDKTQKIDDLIHKTEKKIELLKEKRTSLINHCVTKGLPVEVRTKMGLNPNVPACRPPDVRTGSDSAGREMKDSGVEWIGEIPSHWVVSKFKYLSEIVTGNTPSKTDEELYYTDSEDGFLWVKPTSLNKGLDYVNESVEHLTEEGKNLTRVIPNDSTMICCIGNTIGKHSISGQELSTNQQINSVIPNQEKLHPWFCLFYVDVFTRDLLKWSNFVTLPIYTKSDLEDTSFILPPFEEQTKIVEKLIHENHITDTTIEKETQRITLLKEYRQSLISEVVTGKIDVREWTE